MIFKMDAQQEKRFKADGFKLDAVAERRAQKLARRLMLVTELDANESIFFARELEYIKKEYYDVQYPEMKAREYIPVSFEADPADTTISYYMFDRSGMAQVIRDYSMDLPRIDVIGTRTVITVQSLGASFGYNIPEIKAARKTGRALDQMRAERTVEASRRLENQLAFKGSSTFGLAGFLNHVNVPTIVLPATGVGSSKQWKDKTNDQILLDLALVKRNPFNTTLGIEDANTILLPPISYNLIKDRRIGLETTMTVMKFFQENNPDVEIGWLNELTDGAANGTDKRIMAYRRDPKKVTMEVPQEFEMQPPQPKGLEWNIGGYSRFAGCLWVYPLSAVYADGI